MLFRTLIAFVCASAFVVGSVSVTGCGGGENYRLPVTHPLVPFKKPERNDLIKDDSTKDSNKKPPPKLDMGDDDDSGKSANKPKPPATNK